MISEGTDIVYRHPNGFFVEALVEYVAPDGGMLVWVDAFADTRNVAPAQIVWTSEDEPRLDELLLDPKDGCALGDGL